MKILQEKLKEEAQNCLTYSLTKYEYNNKSKNKNAHIVSKRRKKS